MRRTDFFWASIGSLLLAGPGLARDFPQHSLGNALSLPILTGVIPAASPLPEWARPKQPVPRKALIVGLDKYDRATQLSTPSHDADIVAATLGGLGFAVAPGQLIKGRSTRSELLSVMDQFASGLDEGDIAFVYFSGHGVEREGVNYLVPSDGEEQPESPGHSYLSLPYLLSLLEDANVAAAIVILDACRTDPFAGTNVEDRDLLEIAAPAAPADRQANTSPPPSSRTALPRGGLVRVDTGPPGVLLAYAAQPQQPAFSLFRGDEPRLGSIFTRTVANRLRSTSNYPIKEILGLAEVDVFELTKEKQKPFQNPFGLLYLMLAPNAHFLAMEEELWARTAASGPIAQQIRHLKEFLRTFPGSEHSFAARKRLAELTSAPASMALALDAAPKPTRGDADVFGDLQTVGWTADGSVLAGANRELVVRRNWNTILKSRPVATVGAGEFVKVIGVHPDGNAVRVLTGNGEVGYVGNSTFVPAAGAGEKARITFAGSGPYDEAVNWKPFDQLGQLIAKPGTIVTIKVAKEKEGGVADQVSQLRALRLRDAVIAKGASPDQVLVAPADETLPSQSAEIEAIGQKP